MNRYMFLYVCTLLTNKFNSRRRIPYLSRVSRDKHAHVIYSLNSPHVYKIFIIS